MNLKKQLFTLFTKVVSSNPYISLKLLKILYVVIPKRISEKMFTFLTKKN